jgi:hypothetical protein
MDIIIQLRGWIYSVIIIVAFWVSWKLGVKVLEKKRSFWMAALVSILSSALILIPGGYFGSSAEPDMIGKGIVPFTFQIVFLIINAINIIIFVIKKRLRK